MQFLLCQAALAHVPYDEQRSGCLRCLTTSAESLVATRRKSERGQNASSWSTTREVRSWGTIGRGRLGQISGPSRMRCKVGEHCKVVSRDDTLAFDFKAPRPMLKEMLS